MVSKLKWELSAVTPGDFLVHILRRLPVDSRVWDSMMIRRHAQTFIALSARGNNAFYLKKKNISIRNAIITIGFLELSHKGHIIEFTACAVALSYFR